MAAGRLDHGKVNEQASYVCGGAPILTPSRQSYVQSFAKGNGTSVHLRCDLTAEGKRHTSQIEGGCNYPKVLFSSAMAHAKRHQANSGHSLVYATAPRVNHSSGLLAASIAAGGLGLRPAHLPAPMQPETLPPPLLAPAAATGQGSN